jgi:hypothetical protein
MKELNINVYILLVVIIMILPILIVINRSSAVSTDDLPKEWITILEQAKKHDPKLTWACRIQDGPIAARYTYPENTIIIYDTTNIQYLYHELGHWEHRIFHEKNLDNEVICELYADAYSYVALGYSERNAYERGITYIHKVYPNHTTDISQYLIDFNIFIKRAKKWRQ